MSLLGPRTATQAALDVDEAEHNAMMAAMTDEIYARAQTPPPPAKKPRREYSRFWEDGIPDKVMEALTKAAERKYYKKKKKVTYVKPYVRKKQIVIPAPAPQPMMCALGHPCMNLASYAPGFIPPGLQQPVIINRK